MKFSCCLVAHLVSNTIKKKKKMQLSLFLGLLNVIKSLRLNEQLKYTLPLNSKIDDVLITTPSL
jgi:hypothetical protein